MRSKSETHKGLLSTRPPKKAAQAVFYGGFVKAATKADELSEEKSRDFSSKPMTDEEILKACGGRTGMLHIHACVRTYHKKLGTCCAFIVIFMCNVD